MPSPRLLKIDRQLLRSLRIEVGCCTGHCQHAHVSHPVPSEQRRQSAKPGRTHFDPTLVDRQLQAFARARN
jgi:hypothetical protein